MVTHSPSPLEPCRYSSVGLFVEVKLAEIEAMAGEHARPNRIRTAVAFALFDMLVQRMGSFAPVCTCGELPGAAVQAMSLIACMCMPCCWPQSLIPTLSEMLSSVYVKEELRAVGVDPTAKGSPGHSGFSPLINLSTQVSLARWLAAGVDAINLTRGGM